MRIRPAIPVENPLSAESPPNLRNRRAVMALHNPGTLRLPCDEFTDDPKRWFVQDLVTGAGAPLPVTEGNEVQYLIDGTAYFAQLAEAIRSTNSPTDFIYIIGWILFLDMPLLIDPLDPDAQIHRADIQAPISHSDDWWSPTLRNLLESAGRRGVEIRALIYKNYPYADQVQQTVTDLSNMANSHAIADNRLLFAGAHHQKVVVVRTGGELTGFCGGIDLNPDRLFRQSRPNRPTMNESIDIGDPYHDVQCRIRGPGAGYLLQTFVERWRDHQRVALDAGEPPIPGLTGDVMPPVSLGPHPRPVGAGLFENRQLVQIARTYGDPIHYPPKIDIGYFHFSYLKPASHKPRLRDDDDDEEEIPAPLRVDSTYDFAPHGEQTIKQMLLRAISRAQRFIYLEDQYLMDLDIARAVSAVLPRLAHFTILIPSDEDLESSYRLKQHSWLGDDDPEIGNRAHRIFTNHAPWLRRRFFNALLPEGTDPQIAERVRVFCLTPAGAEHTYVHSKMWIIDDEFVMIGSANCCQRSLTHDAELAVGIAEQPLAESRGFHMPHRLRMALWAEHLGMDTLEGHGELADGVASSVHWLTRTHLEGSRVARYRPANWEPSLTDVLLNDEVYKLIEELERLVGLPQWSPSINHLVNLLTVSIVFDPHGACPHRTIYQDGTSHWFNPHTLPPTLRPGLWSGDDSGLTET